MDFNGVFNGRILDAIPSPKDPRDYHISQLTTVESIDLEEYLIPNFIKPLDQGQFGMCVSFSLKAFKDISALNTTNIDTAHSAGFIYAYRQPSDWQGEGMFPRQALSTLQKFGTCSYEKFPYINNYPILKAILHATVMDLNSYLEEASKHKIASYFAVSTVDEIKTALVKFSPVTICIPVYTSFDSTGSDGIVPLPVVNQETLRGFHEVTIVGWRTINDILYWIVLNSWGDSWADKGYCYLPYGFPITEMWAVSDSIEPNQDKIIPPEPERHFYKVQVGAFLNINNCLALKNKLLESGYTPYIPPVGKDMLYRIQLGAFMVKDNAIELKNKLVRTGFTDAFIVYN